MFKCPAKSYEEREHLIYDEEENSYGTSSNSNTWLVGSDYRSPSLSSQGIPRSSSFASLAMPPNAVLLPPLVNYSDSLLSMTSTLSPTAQQKKVHQHSNHKHFEPIIVSMSSSNSVGKLNRKKVGTIKQKLIRKIITKKNLMPLAFVVIMLIRPEFIELLKRQDCIHLE